MFREYDMVDIEVLLLFVGNWGGILFYLRGNIEGYMYVSFKFKYLCMIIGWYDLFFYYDEEVEV